MIIPSFTLIAAFALLLNAEGPSQRPVAVELGPKAFRDGDVVQITSATATSPRLEQGDTVTVKGRVRLDSCADATLCLFVTQTKGDGREETDRSQRMRATKGVANFELSTTIKHQGVLHLTFYGRKSGKPFGGVYFGTPAQMKSISAWDVSYYLLD